MTSLCSAKRVRLFSVHIHCRMPSNVVNSVIDYKGRKKKLEEQTDNNKAKEQIESGRRLKTRGVSRNLLNQLLRGLNKIFHVVNERRHYRSILRIK